MEFETVLQSDLTKPVQVKQLTGNLFSGDNRGNKITVEVFDNGSPATLMGDVSGYVIRADGKTVVIADTQGTNYTEKDGNRVSVILPQSAYVVVGQVSIVIKVGTVTVGACTSYVYKSTTDQQIDPGSVIPDISTLMGIIEDCIGATEAAESATLAASSAASLATLAAQSAINIATVATQSMSAQVGAKITEINSAIIASSSATAAANTAASGANSAKTAANSAATSANTAALAAQSATSQAIAAAGEVNSAIIAASSATAHAETSALAATSAAAYAIEVADGIEPEIIRFDGTKADVDSTFAYKETSGSVVEFDDGVAEAVKRMDIAIAPLQDLHGYDHPWVGGAGKNKYDKTTTVTNSNVTVTQIANGIKLVGSSRTYGSTYTPEFSNLGLENGATYTISGHIKVISGKGRVSVRKTSNNETIVGSGDPISSGEANFSFQYTYDSSVPSYLSFFTSWSTAETGEVEYTNIQIEKGSSATTYEPYSNICPISGWTGAKVFDTDESFYKYDGTVSQTTGATVTKLSENSLIVKNTSAGYPASKQILADNYNLTVGNTYTVIAYATIEGDTQTKARIGIRDSSNAVNASSEQLTENGWLYVTFTYNTTYHNYLSFFSGVGVASVYNQQVTYTNIQFVEHTNIYSITFPSTAGTVYGGTLTVNQDGTGSLIVDRFAFKTTSDIITADTSITTIAQRTNTLKFWIYSATLPENAGILSSGDPLICDRLPTNVGDVNTYDLVGAQSSSSYSRSYCLSIPTGLCGSTASEIRAYINANPYQFCMKLKSPVSYELTTDQVIRILSGQNTVYADCGDITLLYPTDRYLTAEQAERERIHESIAVSAPVQTIDDGADNVPMDVSVAIEPVQDLHGYANPWVGGAGKNIFNSKGLSVAQAGGITLTKNDDESITISGSANSSACLINASLKNYIPSNTNVTFSLNNSATNSEVGVRLIRGVSGETTQYGTAVYADTVNKTATVSQAFEATHVQVFVKSNHSSVSDITLKIQAEIGTTATAWSPYENICPISGLNKAEVTRTGKNLVNGYGTNIDRGYVYNKYLASDGSYVTPQSQWDVTEYVAVKQNNAYVYSGGFSSAGAYCIEYDEDFNVLANHPQSPSTITFTTNASAKWMRFSVKEGYRTVQLEEGSTASAYEPFGQTYSITFPSSAGTVYGGSLTVNKDGEAMLTVENKLVTLNGSESWNVHGTYASLFYLDSTFTDSYISERNNPYTLTNKYKYREYTTIQNAVNGEYGIGKATASATNTRLVVKDTNYTTVAQFEASLASSNLQVCYRLATPITVKLNPCIIRSLLGTNNIWADTGNILSLNYSADTKLYIDNLTKPTEDDMIANENIPTDTYFTINNTLYKSTEAIAQGETINPNTGGNCVATSVAEVFNSLLSAEGVSF